MGPALHTPACTLSEPGSTGGGGLTGAVGLSCGMTYWISRMEKSWPHLWNKQHF